MIASRISRRQAVDLLRDRLAELVDDDHCLCDVASRHGVFCRGFSQWSLDELKRRYGWQARVGVGGLWGGFGWLYSTKGWMEFYVSRMDGYVLMSRAEGRPLLLSPERAEAFLETVNQT